MAAKVTHLTLLPGTANNTHEVIPIPDLMSKLNADRGTRGAVFKAVLKLEMDLLTLQFLNSEIFAYQVCKRPLQDTP